jgi:hypothetical protein
MASNIPATNTGEFLTQEESTPMIRIPHKGLTLTLVVALLLLVIIPLQNARADTVIASEGFEGAALPLGWSLNGTGGLSGS